MFRPAASPFSAVLAALLLLTASACARTADAVRPPADRADMVSRLSTWIEAERVQKGIPALSVALVDGSKVVWAQGFGWADSAAGTRATAQTVYRVGSVSKLFTDIGIMQQVERGKLDLDAPITAYIPDFHPENPFGAPITIRELTSHRAGLTREPPVGNYFDDTNPTLAATVASLNDTRLVYAPGTHTKYSNAGIAVLGYVLEKTQGQSFYPYLKQAVLEPMGLDHSAFQPLPELQSKLAKAYMWTLDGRRFEAPTFQLGMGPCGSMYTTVMDLGRFLSILFARGETPEGRRVLQRATLDSMWTPQFAAAGQKTGYGIGFGVGTLDGHRSIGHDGAIYGFATTLLALPDDSLGVVVVATLDGVNAVTDHIARATLDAALAAREGKPTARLDTTGALPRQTALALMGRYGSGDDGMELREYEGHLYMTPLRGGSRMELRRPVGGDAASGAAAVAGSAVGEAVGSAGASYPLDLVVDGRLAYGEHVTALGNGRIVVGTDTLTRAPTPGSDVVAMADPKPAAPPAEYAGLLGEYGWNHDVLYIREKDGKLNALIEWFFEYPLERVSQDVYRFPAWGLYDGQQIVFHRAPDGQATEVVAATVAFRRRPLPGDDDAVNFRITPVRPVSELRTEALKATPPKESGDFRTPDLVELRSLDPTIKYDIRYATSNNFMGTPFYTSAHAFMQRPAAEAVVRASAELRKLGYGLLIHDSYRPWYVTKMFWDGTPVDKHVFVADPSEGSRHNRGCAVDLTLYDLKTGQPINMPGGYDEMTDRSYPAYPGGSSSQRWSRNLLRHAMEAQGFTVYEAEWWHFDYKDWRHYPILNRTFEQLSAGQAVGAD